MDFRQIFFVVDNQIWVRNWWNIVSFAVHCHFHWTEDGSVKALLQINSLQPISYFWSIWELYVLYLKTKVFCRKKNHLNFPMDKGLTVPK